jgi:UV DNA damage endonuclease
MRIGFAAIPYDKKLLPVTSKSSARQTMERLIEVAAYVRGLGIDFYRIPANISPRESIESMEDARDKATELGRLFKSLDIRTCFHTTYYCILNSPKPEVLENAIKELECIRLYDEFAGGGNHIEIHAGGVYGDRKSSMERLIRNLLSLNEPIFKMLRLENEEHAGKLGTVDELWHIHRETGIPLLFDVAHYRVNPLENNWLAREIVSSFLDTWKGATTFPVLHYSTIQGRSGTHLPVDPLDFWAYVGELSGLRFDVMLETKEKERDVLKVKAYQNAGIRTTSGI